MKTALYISLFLILVPSIFSGISTWNEIRTIEKSAGEDIALRVDHEVNEAKELKSLGREKSFKESLLILSQNDSIGLVVDLKDSALRLTIHGVAIHETRIKHFRIDQVLLHLSESTLLSNFSKPAKKMEERSTIIKEPIVIREAPKDTIEALLNAYQPDTLIQNPAFLEITLDSKLKLILEQEENPSFRDQWTRFMFHRFLKNYLEPTIFLKVPADELRAIYRALPADPLIVVYLPNIELEPKIFL